MTPPNSNPSEQGTFVFNQRFSGQYFDSETGLMQNYFRDYSPSEGRFLESDPIGLNGGLNSYAYAMNRPTQYVDPLGLLTSDQHMGISALALRSEDMNAQTTYDAMIASVAADFSPTVKDAQSIDSAYKHAMKMPGESDSDAYKRYEDYVNSMINRCDAAGLGRALHAVQDSAAGGHGFQTYTGSVGPMHVIEDFMPSADRRKEALVKSQNVIELFKEKCKCKNY